MPSPQVLDIAAQLAALAAQGSRAAVALQEIDWSGSSLGEFGAWPAALRHSLVAALRSPLPQAIEWGTERVFLPNDGLLALLGDTEGLGSLGGPLRGSWPELWALLHPYFQQVLTSGRPVLAANQPFLCRKEQQSREIYLTCSCVPLLSDGGETAGVLSTFLDETRRVLAERRLRVEEQLTQRLRTCGSLKSLSRVACEVLGTDPEYFPFAILYLLDQERQRAKLVCTSGLTPETAAAPPEVAISGPGRKAWNLDQVIARDEPQVVASRTGNLPVEVQSGPARQAMVLPLRVAGQGVLGALVLGRHPHRPADGAYRAFCEAVAGAFGLAAARLREQTGEGQARDRLARVEKWVPTARLSREGRWLRLSPGFCRLLGYAEAELQGKMFSDLTAGQTDIIPGFLETARREDSPDIGTEVRFRGKGGRWVWVLLQGESIRDADGRLLYFSLVGRDLTAEKMARQAQTVAERRRGDLLEGITDGFLALDHEWRITEVNRAAIEIGGQELSQILGKKLWVHWPQLIGTPLEKELRRALEEGMPAHFEYYSRTLSKWLEVDGYASNDGLALFFRDLTKRKKAESEREESRRKLKLLSEKTIEVAAGENLQDLLQLVVETARNLTGARLAILGHERLSGRFQVGASSRARGYAPCPSGGNFEVQQGGVYLELIRKAPVLRLTDAELRSHPAWWGLPVGHAPLRGLLGVRLVAGQGRADGLIMVSDKQDGADFSEEDELLLRQLAATVSLALQQIEARSEVEKRTLKAEQARRRLTESEARFRAAVDHFPELFVIYNARRRLQFMNATGLELFGQSLEPIVGRRDEEFLPAEITGCFLPLLEKTLETRRVQTGECTLPQSSGETVLNLTYVPLLDARGSLYQILGIGQEITAWKRAEEKIRQATAELTRSNRELEQFAQVISHDLREPLRTTRGFLELVERRYGRQLEPEARDYIQFTLEGADRMEQMIRDLLDYSRVQRQEVSAGPVDLFGVYLSAVFHLQGLIEETATRITHDPLPVVAGDEPQLLRLFQNLLANAIRFRGEKRPRLHLGVDCQADRCLLRLEDNGIGIEKGQQERIFQIFQRLHTQAEYPGTGIGLAICRKIVERHGGRIWVESEPGQGATFFFTLPMAGSEGPAPDSAG